MADKPSTATATPEKSGRGRPAIPKDDQGNSLETPAQAWRRSATVRFNNALRALDGMATLARNPALDVRQSHADGKLTVAKQWEAIEKRLAKAFSDMQAAYAERIANPEAKVVKVVEREELPE